MKANIKKTTYKKLTKIYEWVQCYDENANYHELFIEDVKPKDIPKEVIESFETNHDLTIYIAPGDMVGVFAKDPWEIINYVNYMAGGTAGLQELLGEYTTDEKIHTTVHRLKKVSM
jgi:hypothetical protein